MGGSGAFSSKERNGIESSRIELSPNVGYFFLDKLAGGLDFTITNGKTKFGAGDKTTQNTYGISPFVRYYVLPASNKVNFFAETSYGWGRYKSKTSYLESTLTNNVSSFSISAGPAIFITPNVAIELTAGYGQSTYKIRYNNSTDKSTDKQFQVGIGFQIHLGNKKK